MSLQDPMSIDLVCVTQLVLTMVSGKYSVLNLFLQIGVRCQAWVKVLWVLNMDIQHNNPMSLKQRVVSSRQVLAAE